LNFFQEFDSNGKLRKEGEVKMREPNKRIDQKGKEYTEDEYSFFPIEMPKPIALFGLVGRKRN